MDKDRNNAKRRRDAKHHKKENVERLEAKTTKNVPVLGLKQKPERKDRAKNKNKKF